MILKALVPSLALASALAAFPAASNLQAAEFETNGVKVSVNFMFQSRVELGSVDDVNGDSVDINDGTEDTDPIEFSFRRLRMDIKAYKDDYTARLMFKDDNLGSDESDSGINLHYGWISKDFAHGDAKSVVKFGQDKAFFNRAWLNGGAMLFPQQSTNANNAFAKSKNVGLSYKYITETFTLGADLQNYDKTDDTVNGSMYFSLRGEFTPEGMLLKSWKDSYVGEDGTGLRLGVEYALSTESDTDSANDDTSSFGLDGIFHMDGLTAGFDFDFMSEDDTDGTILTCQAAYALPMESMVVEPALRLSLVDNDTDKDDQDSTFKDQTAGSGTYIDVGVNLYFDGHKNKLQIAIQNFTPEGSNGGKDGADTDVIGNGNGEGGATVFRIQHQFKF